MKNHRTPRWSDQDLQRYRDRDVLRASTVPGRRPAGPSPDEWDVDPDEWDASEPVS